MRILSILKRNSIFSQKVDSIYSFDLYKYYVTIAIVILSFALHFLAFVPIDAESSQNSSSSMINSTNIEALFNKALTLHNEQKSDEAIEYYDKALAKITHMLVH